MNEKPVIKNLEPCSLYRAFEKVSDCGLIFIESGKAVLNDKARAMLGMPEGENDGYMAAISPLLNELRSSSDFADKDLEITLKGSTKTIRALGTNIKKDGEYGGSLITLFDLTARRKRERLQSEFIGKISHALRTPLTSIKAYASILTDELESETNEKQKKYFGIIDKNILQLTSIISDLLDVAKLESGREKLDREFAYMDRLINQLCFFLNDYLEEKQLKLIPETAADLPPVRMDVDKITQVLTNLTDNAVKHTPPGGEIKVGAEFNTNMLEVYVSNTGDGIPPDGLPHIFEKFYRIDKKNYSGSKGIGLGLAIVKQIVNLHGGKVKVDCGPGRDTVFSFSLPVPEEKFDMPSYVEDSVRFSGIMDRKFSLLRIGLLNGDEETLTVLDEIIRKELRKSTDSNPFRSENSLFVGLPNTSRTQAESLVTRLKKSFDRDISRVIEFNLATYPDDGTSSEDIIRGTFNYTKGDAANG